MNLDPRPHRSSLVILLATTSIVRAEAPGAPRVFPIERGAMQGATNAGVERGTAEKLAYSNTEGHFAIEVPADTWLSDDLTLTVENGCTLPWGPYGTDVDRSGVTNVADLLEVIDLIIGAGAFSAWNNVHLPPPVGCR